MFKCIPFIFSALLFFISCNENSTEPGTDNTFSVNIKVVDGNGNPVPDLNISIWNKLPYMNQAEKQGRVSQITASSSFNFRVSEESFVGISLYDLENRYVKDVITTRTFEQGMYEVSLEMNEIVGTAVYKLVMNASTDSTASNTLFRDSIYITLWQPDPQYSLVGKSNQQGELRINKKILFPHLYNPPPVPHTSEADPDILGYFTIPDSVTIAISDSLFSSSVQYQQLITDGKNEFTLVWEGSTGEGQDNKQNIDEINSTILEYFYAETIQNNVNLHWRTLEEENNRGFDIERMSGTSWSTIGFVNGNGTTTNPQVYVFSDTDLSLGIYNYRLKIIQYDGNFTYSPAIEVRLLHPLEWNLSQNYPNPFN